MGNVNNMYIKYRWCNFTFVHRRSRLAPTVTAFDLLAPPESHTSCTPPHSIYESILPQKTTGSTFPRTFLHRCKPAKVNRTIHAINHSFATTRFTGCLQTASSREISTAQINPLLRLARGRRRTMNQLKHLPRDLIPKSSALPKFAEHCSWGRYCHL